MSSQVRIDKWLWAVRIFKTRSLSTSECRKGHVTIDKLPVKPSRMVKKGESIQVRKPPIVRTYKILDVAEKRMAAKIVENFVKDITPPQELEILDMQKNMSWFNREKGTGRPTKKDRRNLDDFFER